MAARDHGKPVVMLCGAAEHDAASGGHRFVDDLNALQRLEWLVDVMAAEAADPADKARILAQVRPRCASKALRPLTHRSGRF